MAVPKIGPMKDIVLQLCEPTDRAFTRDGWLFELKLDGFRVLACQQGGKPMLLLRKGRDAARQFPEIASAISAISPRDFVLDGELVIQDERGHPIFERLLKRSMAQGREIDSAVQSFPAAYFAFDLLVFDGLDLRSRPLRERKKRLLELLPTSGRVRALDHVEREGEALFEEVKRRGLEGIVAKRADSLYRGGRTSDWVKIPLRMAFDFAVVGWARDLRSIHLAAHDGSQFVYAGSVGSGLTHQKMKAVLPTLERNERKSPPCVGEILAEPDDRWTEPELVVEVRCKSWPVGRLIREPTFVRFREDKEPIECVSNAPRESKPLRESQELKSSEHVVDLPPVSVTLSNPKKVLWPDDGINKQQLFDYYRAISPWLLIYLKDRPLMVTRYPDGIYGKSFFQRALPLKAPAWIKVFNTEGPDGPVQQIVCNDIQTLEWLANLAAIPLHIPAHRLHTLELADWCLIDFDPKTAPFEHVVTLALSLKQLCDTLGLPTYVKTSGSSGLHVMIPLGATVPHASAVMLAELLGTLLHQKHPELCSLERVVEKRAGKVYIDCWQNGRLIAAPYCVRAVPGAAVSMPIDWAEVTPKLSPRQFTILNAVERVQRTGDLMAKLLGPAAPLERALERLAAMGQRS